MPEVNRTRIPIEHLEEGMALGDDVVDINGNMLIPRDTVITQKHLFRLRLYQILSVVIQDIPEEKQAYSIEEQEEIDKSSLTFNVFKNRYVESETVIRQQLHYISNGKTIDVENMLATTTSILSTLRTKSDLFSYLVNLRSVDDYTYTHSLNVALLSNIFGQWLKMPQSTIDKLTITGLLHDIGKLKIDLEILNKPGKLTEDEFNIVKRHSQIGYEMIKHQNISDDIKLGVLMHHEKTDGSGYPLGIMDAQIHDFGKIIAIVDIYDAMTSNRSYHNKFSPFSVIQTFEQNSFGLLDITFLFVFLENIAHNYLGKKVRLTDNRVGKIVFIHNQCPSRPIIQIGDTMVDLLTTQELFVEEILL